MAGGKCEKIVKIYNLIYFVGAFLIIYYMAKIYFELRNSQFDINYIMLNYPDLYNYINSLVGFIALIILVIFLFLLEIRTDIASIRCKLKEKKVMVDEK